MALLRVLAIAAVVFFITRWLRRALTGGVTKRAPSGKPWWDDPSRREDSKPKLKTLTFRRDPHDVLGVPKGATIEEIEAAYEALIAQNSPETVAGMDEDIQALAKRKTEEIEEAFKAITEDES